MRRLLNSQDDIVKEVPCGFAVGGFDKGEDGGKDPDGEQVSSVGNRPLQCVLAVALQCATVGTRVTAGGEWSKISWIDLNQSTKAAKTQKPALSDDTTL